MEHLNEISALSRCALAGDTEASEIAVERLLMALMAEDDTPAIDELLTIWDSARHARINNPMRGMKPIHPEPLRNVLLDMVAPQPMPLTLRIKCPMCKKKFLWHASYHKHWMKDHQATHSHQRI